MDDSGTLAGSPKRSVALRTDMAPVMIASQIGSLMLVAPAAQAGWAFEAESGVRERGALRLARFRVR
jgi:hypothetical protein